MHAQHPALAPVPSQVLHPACVEVADAHAVTKAEISAAEQAVRRLTGVM